MSSTPEKKLILVIGATGAQGLAVIAALLAPGEDGTPSPYAVRALTRNTESARAKELKEKGVDVVQGSFYDFPSVFNALQGVYGAWVNIDGFSVGEQKEIYCGMRIFELAKQVGTVRHYVWSNLDYVTKKGKYNPDYECDHSNGKGRVGEWMKAQPSVVSDTDMSWSAVTTGPYMEMLRVFMFGPLNRRADCTFVFATPVQDGHVPMIALADLGWWARYTFDHREETSAKDLEIATEMVSWPQLASTFTSVTNQKAVVVNQSLDDWFGNLLGVDRPVANEMGEGTTTFRQNFSSWWRMWRDDVVKRDMEWIRKVHPNGYTLERWMRETGYMGTLRRDLLKNAEDGRSPVLNVEKASRL
ncbi:hypothetical protein JAAARDRAFT_154298 [Jaapia argillacea MUCL 33604]|uniref:NmrA-like domain-containing protein n=1 Tax=Jaapia argillacea MUCL 33604 TaxID=933084 RepID=A0A067Q6G4_9AGAM|nr:hypothetical protein JAAARDRAFT_154298 [Jaapia argillacea MUCL 33604]